MIENKQLIVNSKKGDCFRACITSILEIPNNPKLPNVDDKQYMSKWYRFFRQFGMDIYYDEEKIWRGGYWIASVPSLNFKNVSHAIVMNGSEVAFDPSTKKRYRKGRGLLGTGIVSGGNWFGITDPSLLHNFISYKKDFCFKGDIQHSGKYEIKF